MQSFTSRADELYRQAEDEVFQIPVYTEPYTSCYDALLEQQELYNSARDMETAAREIRRKFQEISESGFPIHTSSMLRKAVVCVRKGKLAFNHEQVKKVVAMIMQNGAYVLFKPKSDTKEYVILLYWSTNLDESECLVKQQAEAIKNEIAGDNFRLTFRVENVADPKRQFHYLLNNMIVQSFQSDDLNPLPTESHKQLNSFLKIMKDQKNGENLNKRKAAEKFQKLFDDLE